MTRSRIALAALAAAIIVPLSGCASLLSAQQTATHQYAGGDGQSASLGGVEVRGLMVVGSTEDAPGELLFTAVNPTAEDKELTLTVNGQDFEIPVPANSTFQQLPDTEPSTTVDQVGANAGDLVDITLDVDGESLDVKAQVLGDEQLDYANIVPTESAAETPGADTPAPTDEATDEPTAG